MVGRKLMIGPSLTLHAGYQLVPLDSTRFYGAKRIFLQASTAANITLSTNGSDSYTLKSGDVLELPMDGAPLNFVLGSDLVLDGDFADGTGDWTAGTGWAVGGGTAAHGSETGTVALYKTISIEDDTLYQVDYEITAEGTGNTGGLIVSLGGATLSDQRTGGAAVVAHTECILTSNSTGPLRFTPSENDTVILRVDDITVKKITGTQLLFAKATAGTVLQVMFTI